MISRTAQELRWVGVVISVCAAVVAGLAAPASAETTTSSSNIIYNRGFAGYDITADKPETKTVVQAQFTVPVVTCVDPGVGEADFFVEADPGRVGPVTAKVEVLCTEQGATPTYQSLSSLAFGASQPAVSPGDVVMLRAVVDPNTPHNYRTTIENKTTGVTSSNGEKAPEGTVITEDAKIGAFQNNAAGQSYPKFSRFSWVRATFDGQPLGDARYLSRNVLAERKGRVLIWASALNPSGGSFSMLWQYGTF